jgi:hypothetical protein
MCITSWIFRFGDSVEIVFYHLNLEQATVASTVRSRIRRDEKMGKLLFSHWVVTTMATLMGLGSLFGAQTSHAATNPWSRAIGEAKELQWETDDLRNRLNRLYPGSPAAQLSCSLDESACSVVEMVKGGADFYQLQVGLQSFKNIQLQLCHVVAMDFRIRNDQSTGRYLKKVEDRYNYLVADLSKSRPLPPSCPTPGYQSYSNPWALPSPYPSSQPAIPPGYSMPPVIPFGGNQQPSTPNEIPHYWQGSLPSNSMLPGSIHDPHGLNPSFPASVSSNRLAQGDRPPVAAEILGLLIQRASSR